MLSVNGSVPGHSADLSQAWVASFGSPKMTPKSLLASQTGLSPYLRFGCLSVRLFYHQLADLYRKVGDSGCSKRSKRSWRNERRARRDRRLLQRWSGSASVQIKKSNPPLSLQGQLLWREFFYCAATRNPNFDHMHNNPICVQIPWDVNAEALAKWVNVSASAPRFQALSGAGWLSKHSKELSLEASTFQHERVELKVETS